VCLQATDTVAAAFLLLLLLAAVPKALDRYAEIADALVLGGSTKEEKVRCCHHGRLLLHVLCHAPSTLGYGTALIQCACSRLQVVHCCESKCGLSTWLSSAAAAVAAAVCVHAAGGESDCGY
jgi:hypothetical protein